MTSKIVALALLLTTNFAIADTWFQHQKIKDVLVNTSKGVHFRVDGNMANNENCSSNEWFGVETDSKYDNSVLSILLAKRAQQQTVTFGLKGCTKGGYPKISYIY